MRRIVALLLAFVLGVTSTLAFADERKVELVDVYEPKIVPQCTIYTVPGVGTVCGFAELTNWKIVLEADAELVRTRAILKKERERSANLAQQVEHLSGQVSVYAESQDRLLNRTRDLTQQLIELDKKYQNERVKPRWGNHVAWTVAAAAASLLAGFVAHQALD